METEEILSLIRRYVDLSINQNNDPEPAVALAKGGEEVLICIDKHIDTFIGLQRFWVYALARLVARDQHRRSEFLALRLYREDDLRCLILIKGFLKLELTPEQASQYFSSSATFKHPTARKIASELARR